jgi:hypothetical protein
MISRLTLLAITMSPYLEMRCPGKNGLKMFAALFRSVTFSPHLVESKWFVHSGRPWRGGMKKSYNAQRSQCKHFQVRLQRSKDR